MQCQGHAHLIDMASDGKAALGIYVRTRTV